MIYAGFPHRCSNLAHGALHTAIGYRLLVYEVVAFVCVFFNFHLFPLVLWIQGEQKFVTEVSPSKLNVFICDFSLRLVFCIFTCVYLSVRMRVPGGWESRKRWLREISLIMFHSLAIYLKAHYTIAFKIQLKS